MDWTGAANSPNWRVNELKNIDIYGSLTLISTMSMTGVTGSSIGFQGNGSFTLTMAGGGFVVDNLYIDGSGLTLTLQDAFYSFRKLNVIKGTFDANNKNVTCAQFNSNYTNTRTITMGSGTWTINGTGTIWDLTTTTNLTLNANTSTIAVSDVSLTAKTFAGGGKTYNNITFSGDNIGISGNNTFATMAVNNGGLTTGLKFTSGTIQTITSFTTNATVGNQAIIRSTTSGSKHTLSKSSGVITVNYMIIQDSEATGGAVWNATTCVDNGGNSGWNFGNPINAPVFFLNFLDT